MAKIQIRGPQIGIAPDPAGAGLVGLPVWLWTAVGPEMWGPNTATETVPGLVVTITAKVQKIDWAMGNGDVVTCTNPGTPYQASYGASPSPTCGYTYTASSRNQPAGRYVVTGTSTWQVDWTGGGASGVIVVSQQSQTTVRIDELQVVTR